jgi:hypothetical protein
VIDASNLCCMFLTVNEERKFMGLMHPYIGDHYWYTCLPMGSGVAFLRLICQEVEYARRSADK